MGGLIASAGQEDGADRRITAVNRTADEVRVAEIASFRVHLTPEHPHVLSGGRRYDRIDSLIVRVTSADGRRGFGEASTMGSTYLDGFPAGTEAAVRELAPAVLGRDVLLGRRLTRAMDDALVGHHPAKAAMDIALLDLRARILDVEAATLLGGRLQPTVVAFAAVSVGSVRDAVDEAHELFERGYRRLQVKVGDDPLVDAERVRAVATAFSGRLDYLACDANRRWTVAQALRFVNAVGELDLHVEQPCASWGEMVRLRRQCRFPLVADEAARSVGDLLDAVTEGCVDAVNLKPVRLGGVTRAAAARDVAEAAGLMMLVDEPLGGVIASASIAALASTVDPSLLLAASYFADLEYYTLSGRPVATEGGAQFRNGRITASPGPGLGVELDEVTLGEPAFVANARDASDL